MYVRESSSVFRAVVCNVVLGFWFEVIAMSNHCRFVSVFIHHVRQTYIKHLVSYYTVKHFVLIFIKLYVLL